MTCPQLDACISAPAVEDWGKPDVVYLWVDGNDPAWQAQRRSHALLHPDIVKFGYSNVDGRFRDIGELKYSLRSLTRHLDRIGMIYLITDDQRPSWLADHPQLRLVSHRDIRTEAGPTFSSTCLEASVHRIPNLCGHFIYLNDDLFLGESFSVSHLFSDGGRFKLYFDDALEKSINEDPHAWHCIYAATSKSMLAKAIDDYVHYDAGFAHTPRAFSTSAITTGRRSLSTRGVMSLPDSGKTTPMALKPPVRYSAIISIASRAELKFPNAAESALKALQISAQSTFST